VRLRADLDRTLLLLGFWRAFRSDDLCRLRIEINQLVPDEGLTLFLSSSKPTVSIRAAPLVCRR
jgi:hypothetical protein